MPNSPMSPGTVLGGRYLLEDLLSEHDGARFWRAHDTVLARSVAVHAVSSDDPRAEAILDAARASARVTDPHFLRVLDCADTDGLTWVINEWGEGESLDVMLEEGPLPPARAAWLAREVAEAVVAAHAGGICHGRLTPESVLVTRSGSVKLIGFVVYAAFAGPDGRDPTYGVVSDRDADVIDLAGILFAALTGRWPGISPSRVPRAPRDGRKPLRPRQVRAGVPRSLDAICDRVLNREASLHVAPIETALEVCAALSDFVGDPAAAAPVDLPAMRTDPEDETDPGSSAGTGTDTGTQVVADAAPLAGPAPTTGPTPTAEPAPDPAADRASDLGPLPVAEPDQTMPHVFADVDPARFAEPEDREPVPPPPPFEERAERPLFAEHDRRVPAGAAVDPAGTGAGWPFFEDAPVTDVGRRPGPGPRRRRTVIVAVLAVLLVIAMYVAFNAGRGHHRAAQPPHGTPSGTATLPTGTPLRIYAATDFDPEGNPPRENPGETKFAIDGKASTGWQTMSYRGDPRLGGLKSGVGLVLDLGADQSVGSVQVDFVGAPTSFEIWVSPPGTTTPPAELADLTRVTGQTATGTLSVARFSQVHTRFLLIWLTKLPPAGKAFRGEITEVVARP